MNLQLYKFYDGMGPASVLIALSIMFLAGFLLSRVSKLFKLPNVTGYILSGILIGGLILCHAVVAIRWQDFCLVSAGIVFGELVVIGVPGSFYFFSRKIGLKRA